MEYGIVSRSLIQWYTINKRDLPWRRSSDPYIIWISEVILQQTRVDQGYDYFVRFIRRFPNISSLARATEEDVLMEWQGLGYYSRARNLHLTAKVIMSNFGGIFPNNYSDILSLRGIGEYTASAIASIAFGLPHAVVDGNVYRVVSRLFGIQEPIDTHKGKRLFTEIANAIMDKTDPGIYNQAIMDFGSLVCVPRNPSCSSCVVQNSCNAFSQNRVAILPVKKGKSKIKNRYINYFYVRQGDSTFIYKRSANDIWKSLYEFPNIETNIKTEFYDLLKRDDFPLNREQMPRFNVAQEIHLKHVLTHRMIHASFYQIEVPQDAIPFSNKGYIKIKQNQISEFPISQLIKKFSEIISAKTP